MKKHDYKERMETTAMKMRWHYAATAIPNLKVRISKTNNNSDIMMETTTSVKYAVTKNKTAEENNRHGQQ